MFSVVSFVHFIRFLILLLLFGFLNYLFFFWILIFCAPDKGFLTLWGLFIHLGNSFFWSIFLNFYNILFVDCFHDLLRTEVPSRGSLHVLLSWTVSPTLSSDKTLSEFQAYYLRLWSIWINLCENCEMETSLIFSHVDILFLSTICYRLFSLQRALLEYLSNIKLL